MQQMTGGSSWEEASDSCKLTWRFRNAPAADACVDNNSGSDRGLTGNSRVVMRSKSAGGHVCEGNKERFQGLPLGGLEVKD
jgi:hypothetical protein